MGSSFGSANERRMTQKDYYRKNMGGDNYSGPRDWYSDAGNGAVSSVIGGRVTFDPSIRSSYNSIDQELAGLYGQYGDNYNRYIQARVNPLLEARDRTLGSIRTSGGLRGLSGSSFLDQNLAGTSRDYAIKEGDARALGENESIAARQGLLGMRGDIANAKLQQDLAGLGLSQQQIAQLYGIHSGDQAALRDKLRQMTETAAARHKAVSTWAYGWMGGSQGGGQKTTKTNDDGMGGGGGGGGSGSWGSLMGRGSSFGN